MFISCSSHLCVAAHGYLSFKQSLRVFNLAASLVSMMRFMFFLPSCVFILCLTDVCVMFLPDTDPCVHSMLIFISVAARLVFITVLCSHSMLV